MNLIFYTDDIKPFQVDNGVWIEPQPVTLKNGLKGFMNGPDLEPYLKDKATVIMKITKEDLYWPEQQSQEGMLTKIKKFFGI